MKLQETLVLPLIKELMLSALNDGHLTPSEENQTIAHPASRNIPSKAKSQSKDKNSMLDQMMVNHIRIIRAPEHVVADLAVSFFFITHYHCSKKPAEFVKLLYQYAYHYDHHSAQSTEQTTAQSTEQTRPTHMAEHSNETILSRHGAITSLQAKGPYLNIVLNRSFFAKKQMHSKSLDALLDKPTETSILQSNAAGANITQTSGLSPQNHSHRDTDHSSPRIMIEFSSPNTNKPLHLGHLRNNVLGESIARILSETGAQVHKVAVVNDRGIHISQSLAAYLEFGNGTSPKSEGIKPDVFVGNYYVKYNEWSKKHPIAQEKATSLLQAWENGDERIVAQQQQLNEWVLAGIFNTYARTDIHFDTIYFESETYALGKQVVGRGLRKKVFFKSEDGSMRYALSKENAEHKIVLRSDGTSVYITQDLGMVFKRYEDWPFDQMIYVVAHEQNYHFRVLFSILTSLGFIPALQQSLVHLSYGMVNLPQGRMKSREGTIVDADGLIDRVAEDVKTQIIAREKEYELEFIDHVAEKVAVGAIHYYLLRTHPKRDLVFDVQKSISFEGNTGPYLQYTSARLSSLLERYATAFPDEMPGDADPDYILPIEDASIDDTEWEIMLLLDELSTSVYSAAEKKDPSQLAHYCYQLASASARWYQSFSLLKEKNKYRRQWIVALIRRILATLKLGMRLLVIPFLEKM